jgi:hypothetical protein
MSGDRYVHWAWLVRDLRETALREWRDAYAPGVPIPDLWALHLRRVRVIVDQFAGGTFDVYVRVQARRASSSEWYFWKVRHLAGEYHILD